jgi:hypothetical protein
MTAINLLETAHKILDCFFSSRKLYSGFPLTKLALPLSTALPNLFRGELYHFGVLHLFQHRRCTSEPRVSAFQFIDYWRKGMTTTPVQLPRHPSYLLRVPSNGGGTAQYYRQKVLPPWNNIQRRESGSDGTVRTEVDPGGRRVGTARGEGRSLYLSRRPWTRSAW